MTVQPHAVRRRPTGPATRIAGPSPSRSSRRSATLRAAPDRFG